jgi:hypothetical protein
MEEKVWEKVDNSGGGGGGLKEEEGEKECEPSGSSSSSTSETEPKEGNKTENIIIIPTRPILIYSVVE